MKIIAATDFSPAAANAARAAARLARKLGDSLVLLRVIEPEVATHPELRVPDAAGFDAALMEADEARMAKAVASLCEEGVSVEVKVLVGPPVSRIIDQASDERARLIVMGRQGRNPAARLVLGSVAERTVMAAPCPVLVVPEKAAPFDDWVRDQRPLRVLAGLDLDSAGEAVLAAVDQLRSGGQCDVSMVHTYAPATEYVRLGLTGPRDLMATDPEIVAVLEREIASRFAVSGVRVQSAWNRPAEALADDAEAEKADVLVIGTRQPHAWTRVRTGSTALAALRAARGAVLCVPARCQPSGSATSAAIPVFRTVLVATDFSDLANAAIPYAYALLRAGGGTVELCHVHERALPTPGYVPYEISQPLAPAEKTAVEARLRGLVPANVECLGIETRVNVVDGGAAASAIVQASRRLGADAIVLTSHGRSGLTRALLASVAETVLRQADRPVLVVRPPAG